MRGYMLVDTTQTNTGVYRLWEYCGHERAWHRILTLDNEPVLSTESNIAIEVLIDVLEESNKL